MYYAKTTAREIKEISVIMSYTQKGKWGCTDYVPTKKLGGIMLPKIRWAVRCADAN